MLPTWRKSPRHTPGLFMPLGRARVTNPWPKLIRKEWLLAGRCWNSSVFWVLGPRLSAGKEFSMPQAVVGCHCSWSLCCGRRRVGECGQERHLQELPFLASERSTGPKDCSALSQGSKRAGLTPAHRIQNPERDHRARFLTLPK